jgi:hypothetical protein
MSKAVVVLSISTAILAASTVYLASELYRRDSVEDAATIAGVEATSGAASLQASPATTGSGNAAGAQTPASILATSAAAQPPAKAAAPDTSKRDAQSDAVAGFARQFLVRYDDANQRPVLLEEQRTVIRRQYERLKEQLKLSDSAFEQLVSLVAEEQLQFQEHWARCAVDSGCDPKNQRNPNIDHTQEYQAMLGAEGAEAFTQFRDSISERDSVVQLRGRLPDSSFLPEVQAEKLIGALAEERTRYSQEAAARGAKTAGWGTNLGMLMYIEDSGSPEQYVVEASQYSQRLRTRAAAILTPMQLAAFAQMQDELLAQFTANQHPPSRQNKTSLVRSG